jgi:hypothetical protein
MLASENPSIGPAKPQPLNNPPAAHPSPQATSSLQQGSSQAGSQQSLANATPLTLLSYDQPLFSANAGLAPSARTASPTLHVLTFT